MAHSRTAKKNIRKNSKRREANRAATAAMRTTLKRVRATLHEKKGADAVGTLGAAQTVLDKAAKANRIHPNKAARLKSRLAKAANAASKA